MNKIEINDIEIDTEMYEYIQFMLLIYVLSYYSMIFYCYKHYINI